VIGSNSTVWLGVGFLLGALMVKLAYSIRDRHSIKPHAMPAVLPPTAHAPGLGATRFAGTRWGSDPAEPKRASLWSVLDLLTNRLDQLINRLDRIGGNPEKCTALLGQIDDRLSLLYTLQKGRTRKSRRRIAASPRRQK
jgi:hypothetical protein